MTQSSTLQTAERDKGMDMFGYASLEDEAYFQSLQYSPPRVAGD